MKELSRPEAEAILSERFGIAHFYDEQWKVIDALLHGQRILMIEKTGFGKSLCFQFPAILFDGVTIVFSPLIALMRDQVTNLNKRGISAGCINSGEEPETNSQTLADAIHGKIKILFIAPERQGNQEWQTALQTMKISMIVVDEAHCISQWGHDFRPDYRRIRNIVNAYLPTDMPVLAVTATATPRVQQDIEEQLGGRLTVVRGELMRKNFRLFVIRTTSEEEKMVWLKQHLADMPGTGIVYAGTRTQTELYARWLTHNDISAVEYNASLDTDSRKEIEKGLKENRWKCVVSTNALGMGIDKPDIRFIIHLQMPASPIHYYQEIGRAGRDGQTAYLILFFNERKNKDGIYEDLRLPISFIEGARPSETKYRQVIDAVRNEPLGEKGIALATNLRLNVIRTIKEDLKDMGIIREIALGRTKTFEYCMDAPTFDMSTFEALNKAKRKDLQKMIDYVFTTMPRMKYLCQYLGDETNADFSMTCDNSGLQKKEISMTEDGLNEARAFKDNMFPILKAQRNIAEGIAASYYGATNVGAAIHHCKYENGGDFPDFLVRLTLKAYYHQFKDKSKFDIILFVPPTESGNLVRNFARKIGNAISTPVSEMLIKTRKTDPQKIFENTYGKKENVKDAFTIIGSVEGKSILLIDDIYDSGATIKAIATLLMKNGAKEVAPLVIAKTVGGDRI